MKKREMNKLLLFLILLVITPLFFSIVYAEESSTENLTPEEKAYKCLSDLVKGDCSSLTDEQKAFSLLALSYDSSIQRECKSALKSSSKNNGECWPSSSCDIKTTAISVIALANIRENTGKAEDWILDKEIIEKDLEWFLQIDSDKETECTISYDNQNYKITIGEDKKISSNAGSCFSLYTGNYWLKINSICYEKNFTVSCDESFISNLIYKRKHSDLWYLSKETKSSSGGGKNLHKVTSLCFSNDGINCNYESTLWATLALDSLNKPILSYLPYLTAFASISENEKYLPFAFMYILTNSENYLSNLLSLQHPNGYWPIAERYFSTALGILSVSSFSSQAKQSAIDWLYNTQDTSGCWNNNNIRDTAFILWATWGKTPVIDSDSGVVQQPMCSSAGYHCWGLNLACINAGGETLSNFYCSGVHSCCSVSEPVKTCAERGWTICAPNQECSSAVVETKDTTMCCPGICREIKSECEQKGFSCRTSCFGDEEEVSYSCDSYSLSCCRKKTETSVKKSSIAWIWILAILILLAVLAILFKDKIKLMLFKKSKRYGSTGVVSRTRPFGGGFMPQGNLIPGRRPMRPINQTQFNKNRPSQFPPMRYIPTRQNIQHKKITKPRTPQEKSSSDRELEETMRKLRELGKE